MHQTHRTTAAILAFAGAAEAIGGSPFPAFIDLSSLDASVGVAINGVDDSDQAGFSVSSAGDVNGDGIDDIIIGAFGAEPNGHVSGAAYVVFGALNIGAAGAIELSSVNGANGFVINGIAGYDYAGRSVSGAGDINGDGYADLIIGATGADPSGDRSGQSYVVFGGPNIGAGGAIELSSLNGVNGFAINGVDEHDGSGASVSAAGDVNGDGMGDIIIGAPGASPAGLHVGVSYVVFGAPAIGASGAFELASINGANGFDIRGAVTYDFSGFSVAAAGDVNNDGFDDVIISAFDADPHGHRSGESYVVFGGKEVAAGGSLELATLNGLNGFAMRGIDENDYSGFSVSGAGDVNDDGIDDVIVGAFAADPNGFGSGEGYVVFGAPTVGAGGVIELSSLNGANGFTINGIDLLDHCGRAVAAAGDVNGDGVDDLIIGAYRAGPLSSHEGESYIIFGASDVGTGGVIEISTLDVNDGFTVRGDRSGDHSGEAVSCAGDVNGDGVADLLIGARQADPNGSFSGQTFVIFGRARSSADLNCDGLISAVDLAILLSFWGPCAAAPTPCPADIDGSGDIGASDLAQLIGLWGS